MVCARVFVVCAVAATSCKRADPPAARTDVTAPAPPAVTSPAVPAVTSPAVPAVGSSAPPAAANAQDALTPVPLGPEALPGWTFRSAKEGWWTAAGDEQLYASHIDLGNLAVGKSAAERAELVASVFRESNRRQGSATLALPGDSLAAQLHRPVACMTAINVDAHARAFSCGLARDTGPVLGVEYTSYRDDSDDVFLARARALVLAVATASK